MIFLPLKNILDYLVLTTVKVTCEKCNERVFVCFLTWFILFCSVTSYHVCMWTDVWIYPKQVTTYNYWGIFYILRHIIWLEWRSFVWKQMPFQLYSISALLHSCRHVNVLQVIEERQLLRRERLGNLAFVSDFDRFLYSSLK